MTPAPPIDELWARLVAGAAIDDEERVDVLAHSLQCAAELVAAAPDDLELQIAGLVHDVGTVLDPKAMDSHAGRGGAYVAPVLGPRVARLVALHADAKRYLVAIEPGYRKGLSERSLETLVEQGGVMTNAEASAFSRIDDLVAVVTLRRADDAAKVAGRVVPDLEAWRDRLDQVASSPH